MADIKKEELGLGDKIEKITKATGIKKVVDTLSKATGVSCGCAARKKKLNDYSKRKRESK